MGFGLNAAYGLLFITSGFNVLLDLSALTDTGFARVLSAKDYTDIGTRNADGTGCMENIWYRTKTTGLFSSELLPAMSVFISRRF